jgi:RHH-type rel operon transcriptional repressor/antitoxin RelB
MLLWSHLDYVNLCTGEQRRGSIVNDSTIVTVRVDRATKQRLEAVAKSVRRSKSFIAAAAIEEYLAAQEWQMAGIREAMESMDRGEGIPHQRVSGWIASWDSEDELPMPDSARRWPQRF